MEFFYAKSLRLKMSLPRMFEIKIMKNQNGKIKTIYIERTDALDYIKTEERKIDK